MTTKGMRPLILALTLSAVALSAPAASAQSCTLPKDVEAVRVQNCRPDWPHELCRPGQSIRLSAEVTTFANACPFEVTWDFGDGTPPQKVAGNEVEHVFATTGYHLIWASVQTHTGLKKFAHGIVVAHGYFSFTPTVEQVIEGGSFHVTLTRDDTMVATSVDYETQSSPFLEQKSGTVQFAAGEAQKKVSFKTVDTLFAEGDRTARVSWSNAVGHEFKIGQITTTTVQIQEDDEETDHRCQQTTLTAQEKDGLARIRLNRSGNLTIPSTGTVTIAPAWRDQWLNSVGTFSVAFAAGQATADVDVPLQNNNLWDGHQQTKVACGGFTGPLPRKTDSELLLSLQDDDPQPVVTVPPVVTITESDALQVVSVPLTLSGGASFPLWIGVKPSDDSATSDDYEVLTNVAEFWIGETMKPIAIRLTGDNLAEKDEQFIITLTGDVPAKFKVKVVDDDRAPFSVALDRQSYESDESTTALTLTRSGDVSAPGVATLHFEPTYGHGGWPADFDVAFAAGEAVKTLTIPAGDQWYTGDRTAMLEVRTMGLLDATAEVTLHDDDPQPVVTLLGATVEEGAPGELTQATVTIQLSAPLGVELDVRATTAHGTAAAEDYTPLEAKHLSIRPGEMSATVTLQIRGDDVAEGNETFTLTLSHCCEPAITAGPLTATVTIRDDDAPEPLPPGRRRSVRH